MVVTGALEYVADRVAHLVYLDAFKPDDGQSLRDLSGAPYQAPAIGPGSEWLVEPLHRPLEDEAQVDWFSARRSWHPVGCFTEAVRLRMPLEDFPFTRTYVKALKEPPAAAGTGASAFWRAAEYAKTNQAWRYREIDTDHMIPINRPAELVELLLELTHESAELATRGRAVMPVTRQDPASRTPETVSFSGLLGRRACRPDWCGAERLRPRRRGWNLERECRSRSGQMSVVPPRVMSCDGDSNH
jgi:hypothetical protein